MVLKKRENNLKMNSLPSNIYEYLKYIVFACGLGLGYLKKYEKNAFTSNLMQLGEI